jgi:hypothetical protein
MQFYVLPRTSVVGGLDTTSSPTSPSTAPSECSSPLCTSAADGPLSTTFSPPVWTRPMTRRSRRHHVPQQHDREMKVRPHESRRPCSVEAALLSTGRVVPRGTAQHTRFALGRPTAVHVHRPGKSEERCAHILIGVSISRDQRSCMHMRIR